MSRLQPQAIIDFLAQTVIFRECPQDILGKLAPHVEQPTFEAKKFLVAPGSVVATLNFLYSGKASMQVIDVMSGERTHLEDVNPGDTYGEVGLALGAASPAVVVADEACMAIVIHKPHLDKVAQVVPSVSQALLKRVATRFVKVSLLGTKRSPTAPATATPSPVPAAPQVQGIRFVETSQFDLNNKILDFIPSRLILEHRMLPLDLRGSTLTVGMVTPSSPAAKAELRRILQSADPEIVAIGADDFAQAVTRLKLDVRDKSATPVQGRPGAPVKVTYQVEIKKEADKAAQFIGEEVVNLVDKILCEAVDRNVSDIHIEPEATQVRVRYRIQGMLQERKEIIPPGAANPIVARLKVLAELDITDRRMPQDGRIVARFGTRELNMRISTFPVSRGEKAVLRILDPSDIMRPVEHIILDPRAGELAMRALSSSHGAIIVAGATGSGKTSTLYSLLNQRRKVRPDHAIVTVEDPIEFLISGITQSSVNARAGMEYPTALRALLRQDPDVIMIGELRDSETCSVTLEAAVTGHLVMATAHASNIAGIFQRFEHFGADSARLAQAVSIFLVQKLMRKLCSQCVREDDVAPQLVEGLLARNLLVRGGSTRLPKPGGCEACSMTGYRGRVAAIEMLFFDDAVRTGLATNVPTHEVLKAAQAAGTFLSFAQCARLLMTRKAITPADALAATD